NKLVPKIELAPEQNTALGRRICVVTGALAGPSNSAIGTSNRTMALLLRELGYRVDILYTRVHEGKPTCDRGSFAEHVEAYRNLGINLVSLDHSGACSDWQAISYLALQNLIHQKYDLVFFDSLFGTAYYSLLARRTGNAELSSTKMCVAVHDTAQLVSD